MLLTSSKVMILITLARLFAYYWTKTCSFFCLLQTSLRHPECSYAKENRDTIFCQMRRAMDLIHYVVKDGVIENTLENFSSRQVIRISV